CLRSPRQVAKDYWSVEFWRRATTTVRSERGAKRRIGGHRTPGHRRHPISCRYRKKPGPDRKNENVADHWLKKRPTFHDPRTAARSLRYRSWAGCIINNVRV